MTTVGKFADSLQAIRPLEVKNAGSSYLSPLLGCPNRESSFRKSPKREERAEFPSEDEYEEIDWPIFEAPEDGTKIGAAFEDGSLMDGCNDECDRMAERRHGEQESTRATRRKECLVYLLCEQVRIMSLNGVIKFLSISYQGEHRDKLEHNVKTE